MDVKSKPLQVVVAIARDLSTGRLLFQERQKSPYSGYFGLVGGKIEPDESREDAIKREFSEETGLTLHDLKYINVVVENLISGGENNSVALHIYLAETSGKIQANEAEGRVHWVSNEHFTVHKERYIPADWLIVDAVINERALFSEITVETNNEGHYEITSIS